MRHGSLFSGIGGFDLAAEWMGWENVFHCEWNEFGQKVLKHYWPNAESFSDITKTDFTKYYGTVDIITGGFPCQPYSSAGKRRGKEDERHLWPEMLRAIREVSPRFVVGENVRGLTNWNGGLVFDEVCAELESYGYQVAPVIIPACGVGAPHRRERIWFVAYADNTRTNDNFGINTKWQKKNQRRERQSQFKCWENGCNGITTNTNGTEQRNNNRANNREAEKVWRENKGDVFGEFCSNGTVTNTSGSRLKADDFMREPEESIESTRVDGENVFTNAEIKRLERLRREARGYSKLCRRYNGIQNWQNFPTQSPVCSGDDGLPSELDGITFSKWRNESIKAYGNAIVPQVAYEIFKAIIKTI